MISEKEYIKECMKEILSPKYLMPLKDKKRKLQQAIFWFKLSYKHLIARGE